MRRIKRIATSLQRLRRSRGFGIHSPFAFHFVVRVLKENAPYYCYDELKLRRREAVALLTHAEHPMSAMSLKNAKMLLRIAAFFHPSHVLVLGSHYGLGVAALLSADSRSTAVSWEGPRCYNHIFLQLSQPFGNRITACSSAGEALGRYTPADGTFFMLVNDITGASPLEITEAIQRCIDAGGVAVLRHLHDNPLMTDMWQRISAAMTSGMMFTNGKIGIAVANPRLPRQNFMLWF